MISCLYMTTVTVETGLIAEAFLILFFVALCNGLTVAEIKWNYWSLHFSVRTRVQTQNNMSGTML